jgi:hypothetical protein
MAGRAAASRVLVVGSGVIGAFSFFGSTGHQCQPRPFSSFVAAATAVGGGGSVEVASKPDTMMGFLCCCLICAVSVTVIVTLCTNHDDYDS